ncbi:acyl-CoA desaturase [Geothrix sp. PMB-07]|uniref:acyl-CoA desaturase n=1 Tax=Geothrix sp. PMB-07 TaxID=3068640 RepID=UPI002740D5F5|nr:acyl-CoA desaturase [Geothrix sp. PMB-07]WLT33219.1 acyl-CoA desaturase [Geothrix sp. PMB-07]
MAQQAQRSLLNTLFLWGTLILALILVPLKLVLQGLRWSEVGMFLLMYTLIGLSVTIGYHRLFSHRAFRAAWPLRLAFLVFGAAAFENSALWWSSDHRQHHRFVDDPEGDPYAISKGFWYAHWVWVMEGAVRPLEAVEDLQKDPLVRWQHRYHFWIGAVVALIPVYVGWATGNVWGHAAIGLLLRIVATHHSTFLINSAAHRWGSQPYSDTNSSRDNAFLAPLTFGEGYHNFHHKWQWDYRNAAKWYQWDPGKWLISLFAWVGLAHGLRRVPETQIQRARLDMEAKRLAAVLASTSPTLTEDLRERLGLAKARMEEALGTFQSRREAWEALTAEWKAKGQARGAAWQDLRGQWKSERSRCQQELRAAWADWKAARLKVLAFDGAS